MGYTLGADLARALGLDPARVGKITIEIDPAKPVVMTVEVYAADVLRAGIERYEFKKT